jgi:hypothetical protein
LELPLFLPLLFSTYLKSKISLPEKIIKKKKTINKNSKKEIKRFIKDEKF